MMGIPYGEVDKIAKMIPEKIGITLKNALILSRELAELRKSDKRVAKLLDYAMTLEGLSRHCSTHAAGVVIAPTALTNYVPLFKGSKDEITTQYDMKMVEKIGLLKMDFLGLRTLTVIDDCLKMVKENHDVDIDIDNVELDDPEVYKIFATGNSVGVFQFESSGMRDYLRKLKPTNFTDITAMNALYRPGPLDSGMINIYVDCKNGSKKQVFLHPILEDILGDTYGVIVFQEQVLKIANLFAGYSLGKADLLRKAMGKKDAELMAQQKKEFIAGADKKKIDRKISEEVFNQIETFARYGFNKAHSTCYAFIAYQTAWLKNYYPKEFMAALMTSEINSSDRIYLLMEDCRRLKIEVLPPDMNESQIDFSVVNEKIKFGLKAVKNVGDAPARAIVKEREAGGKYNTLSDLVRRVDVKTINRRTLESLIAAGASDSMEGFRSQKFALVEEMLEFGHKVRLTDNSHDLFAAQGQSVERVAPALKDISEWTTAEKLRKEKEMLGFYVSGHPLDKFKNELRSLTSLNLSNLGNVPDDREVSVGGIVAVVRKNTDKKGNQMAFATIEDYSGNAELIIFSSCYEKCQDLLKIDSMVLVTGRVSTRENEAPKIIVNEIAPIEKLTEHFKCQLVIKVDENYSDTILEEVFSSLEKYKGDTPVLIAAKQNGSEVFIRSRKYNVRIDFELLNSLKDKLGESEVFLRPLNRI